MPDQPISDQFCSSRCFHATDVQTSLMSTSIILLSSSCSDPGHSLQGAELTSKVVAEELAPALKIPP